MQEGPADGGAEIQQLLNEYGVTHVVAEKGFWTDLEALREFERALATDQFALLEEIHTEANYEQEKVLAIYEKPW